MIKARVKLRKSIALLGLGALLWACGSQDDAPPVEVLPGWKVGDVIYDDNQWLELIVGDMPLVISVPHGGSLKPDGVPDRDCAGITTVRDSYTIEMARAIQQEMMGQYGKTPFIIIANIARTKIDLNRELGEATCNNVEVKQTWEDFHTFVDRALELSVQEFGSTLYIDLHAHGHEIQRLELGYNLGAASLGKVYTGTDLEQLGSESSLGNLLNWDGGHDIQALLHGDHAFGTLMAERGIPCVPSLQDPYPMASEPFFNGGFNTRQYTSPAYPEVAGWQIETNRDARDTPQRRSTFAKAFCDSYFDYINALNL